MKPMFFLNCLLSAYNISVQYILWRDGSQHTMAHTLVSCCPLSPFLQVLGPQELKQNNSWRQISAAAALVHTLYWARQDEELRHPEELRLKLLIHRVKRDQLRRLGKAVQMHAGLLVLEVYLDAASREGGGICWRDYISHLGQETPLSVPQGGLEDVFGERDVWSIAA